ncbi:uncharacterized protein LOC114734525 [Neltuma alba]|uniref:uncharacterized protein LOC114734525 n=1 Tax=Neltuma alba TaxID=207710 RepID=UPI0010A42CA7|nr:uncharacterized protein LOC114734525 [Prosopis alba]
MGDRKDDVRIYIIFVFFFFCSTAGGILLCLYIFVPSAHKGESWFAILGLVLVAIPWITWFLIYIYRCFKPMVDAGGHQFRRRNSHDNNNNNKPSSGTPKSAAAPSEAVARPSVSSYESVATHSQNNGGGGGGERHVHFGAVVVVENGSSRGSNSTHSQRQHQKVAVDRHEEFSSELECTDREEAMSESERPLTSVTRS